MAKQHHERCRFSSKVLVTALLCLLEPLSAKYISGIVQTASCMKRLGSFTFGTASTLATNTIVTIDVPERYENVWLVGITSTTNMWGTTDLEDIMGGWTCYDIIKTIANLVVDAYPDNVQVPTVSEFLSYSADPEFLLQFPAVRLNKNSLTPDEIFAKEVFDVSSISSTCTGDTSIVSDGYVGALWMLAHALHALVCKNLFVGPVLRLLRMVFGDLAFVACFPRSHVHARATAFFVLCS